MMKNIEISNIYTAVKRFFFYFKNVILLISKYALNW